MKRPFVTASFFVLSLAFFGSARAAPGDLDVTFDTDGLLTTAFGSGTDDEASAVVLQGDGKIVVAGYSNAPGSYDFALARYNADGSLDPSFDSDGRVTTDISGSGSDDAFGSPRLVLQEDGKIVAAGGSKASGTVDFALVRYNPDGSLDPSFDLDGRVTTDISGAGSADSESAIVIQEDGKIVVGGTTDTGGGFVLVRYNTDGSLDTSFDADGKVQTSFAGVEEINALALQADGKIVAVGRDGGGASNDFAVARYNTDGSLDTSFDSDGKVSTDISAGSGETARAVAVQSDGKILAAGASDASGSGNFAMIRYNSDGSLDTSFDTDGKVITDFPGGTGSGISSMMVQADGKILAGGAATITGSTDFALARYNSDGSLDTSFGTDGRVTTNFSTGSDDFGEDAVIQANGRIVLVGLSCTGAPCLFALARYQGDTADLAITKTVDATSVALGATVTYSLTVTNNGPQAASGVTVTDDLPAGVTLASASSTQGTCTGTDPVTCSLGSIASGASAINITITVTADAAGTIGNTATVEAVQVTDPDSSNNTGTASAVTVTEGGGGCAIVP